MVIDLIRALLVATLVLGLPGYLWSRALFAAADWVERLAATIAMSVALVPLIALLLARILGTGITLGIAIAASCLVTGGGAVIWWRFRSAVPVPAQWRLEAPRLRDAALIPLILAGCCITASLLRVLPVRTLVPYTLLLIVLSGVLHILAALIPLSQNGERFGTETSWRLQMRRETQQAISALNASCRLLGVGPLPRSVTGCSSWLRRPSDVRLAVHSWHGSLQSYRDG